MTTYGLTTSGFVIKPLDTILAELRAEFETRLGVTPVETPDDPIAVLLGITANQISQVWELAQALYSAWNRANAGSTALDNINSLLLLTRRPATYTTATVTLGGTTSTTVPEGSIVETEEGVQFATDEDATIPGDVTVTAVLSGAQEVDADTITRIVTTVAGWTTVNNDDPAVTGTAEESDAAFRLRALNEASVIGRGTVDAILSRFLDPEQAPSGLQFATINENPTDTQVGDLPPYSFELVVYPDTTDSDDIVELLWSSRPAGITPYGTTRDFVYDSQGTRHAVWFTYASEVSPAVVVTLTPASGYPADGDALVKNAVVDYINSLGPGQNILQHAVVREISDAVPGITQMTVQIDGSTADYTVAGDEIARITIADVTVS